MRSFFLSLLIIFFGAFDGFSQMSEYIIVKLEDGKSIENVSTITRGANIKRALEYLDTNPQFRGKPHTLRNFYRIKVNSETEKKAILESLNNNKGVIYAEPERKHQLLFIPDDPIAAPGNTQGKYLSVIKAFEAWDINKGDPNLIIAIVDSGSDLDHPDLVDNLYLNLADPVNGVDDDGDGKIDNYRGWDFADDDNDPEADNDPHGTEVAGQAAATTNNGVGIAGVGFNSKYMPLKSFKSSNDEFQGGFEAIVYAADMGCKVINLSWGAHEGGYLQYEQDFINYAALEKDVVIVAAAGNTNAKLDFYPASYDHVISVGATKEDDRKTSFSTYSYKIDLMAPGEKIYSTSENGNYNTNTSGTSFSSPLVAGAAALVRSEYPALNALQVIEKLRITSDDIYGVSGNGAFEGMLGKGRLNVFRALDENISPSVRFRDISYKETTGQVFFGDTLKIRGNFINYLQPTPNLRVTISSTSSYATIISNEFIAGPMSTLDTVKNTESPFKVFIHEDTPPETSIVLRVDYKDGFYEDFQYLEITTAGDFVDIDNDKVAMTLAGNGNIGYPDYVSGNGIGFLKEETMVFSFAGLVISDGTTTVVDNMPNNFSIPTRDEDFETEELIRLYTNSNAKVDARSIFNNEPGLGLLIEQRALAWEDNHIVVEYRIINQSGGTITDLNTALFTDWDLNDYTKNKTGWDAANNLGYVYDHLGSEYAGVGLLTGQSPIFYALDRDNQNGNTADIDNTISKAEKYTFTSQGIGKINAGAIGDGNDVSIFNGAEIASLADNEVATIVMAYLVGSSLSELQTELNNALNNYNSYLNDPPVESVSFTCSKQPALLEPGDGTYEFYSDADGTIILGTGNTYTTPPISDSETYYAKRIDLPYVGRIFAINAIVKDIFADFDTSPTEILIQPGGTASVIFVDQSNEAVSWDWDFDNGFTSTQKNPTTIYDSEGDYNVSLSVENQAGCSSDIEKIVMVRNAGIEPDIEDNYTICGGSSVTIEASNTDLINVYEDENLANKIFTGKTFVSEALENSINYYVTNAEGTFESFPVEVFVQVDPLYSGFSYTPDQSIEGSNYHIKLKNESSSWANSIDWTINGTDAGNENSIIYDYTGLSSIIVSIKVVDSLACEKIYEETIIPQKSPTPVSLSETIVCSGSDFLIEPSNANYFRFYGDENLETFIGKGDNFKIESILEPTTVYVTSVDNLLDSDPFEVFIDISKISAEFTVNPEIANIGKGDTTVFTSTSEDAIGWFWEIDGKERNSKEVFYVFDEEGEYSIMLMVWDQNNCTDTSSIIYPVENQGPAGIGTEISQSPWTTFPNPTDGIVYIEGPLIDELSIYDLQGKKLNKEGVLNPLDRSLDLNFLKAGIYFLGIEGNKNHQLIKIIVE